MTAVAKACRLLKAIMSTAVGDGLPWGVQRLLSAEAGSS